MQGDEFSSLQETGRKDDWGKGRGALQNRVGNVCIPFSTLGIETVAWLYGSSLLLKFV